MKHPQFRWLIVVLLWVHGSDVHAGTPTLATPVKPVVLTHESEVKVVNFSADGKKIITQGKQLKLWDATTGQPSPGLNLPESLSSKFRATAASPDLSFLSLDSVDRTKEVDRDAVSLFDSQSQTVTASFPTERNFVEPLVQFSPDGKFIAIADQWGVIKIRDTSSGQETATLKTGEDGKLSSRTVFALSSESTLAFSPDSKIFAATCGDQRIRLWDAKTGGVQLTIDEASVHLIAFSSDGKSLAGAYGFGVGKIYLWDTTTGENRMTFPTNGVVPARDGRTGSLYAVKAIAFSPDGKMFASAMAQTVSLWDLENRQSNTYAVHSSNVNCLAFSPDGKFLATGSDDKTVRLWKVVASERQ